ncbi:unnamed protein product [Meganyctiphanes norvegica]|uniref:G-protein coupled receptors family 1 profile domain-containing protein n=1 Tax=Meganyctiphanes norvegica TaxID=48144 RepID=A0AAV2PX36_MEGNR
MSVASSTSEWLSSPRSWTTASTGSSSSIQDDDVIALVGKSGGNSEVVGGLLGLAVSHVLDHENLNMTLGNSSTDITGIPMDQTVIPHVNWRQQCVITIVYIFGILGNLAALYIITRKETTRYKKQALMLRCLACNDLVALVGSFILMHMNLYMPVGRSRWFCAMRVVVRSCGLGSGCVALVMALERWLALTHPFTYQRHVTYTVIRRAILCLWLGNLLYVCAPFLGFGLWYDSQLEKPCVPYKYGTSTLDRTYAYGWFVFGMVMCLCIVMCNMCVIRAMCRLSSERQVPRRHSRGSSRSTSSLQDQSASQHAPSCEELAFAKLMALLSIFFVICWVPQLTMILVAQVWNVPRASKIYRVADIFIALNFSLDPYMYVLFRRRGHCSTRHMWKVVTLCLRHQPEQTSPRGALSNGSGRLSGTSQNHHMGERSSSVPYTQQTSISSHHSSSEKEYVPLHVLLDDKNKAIKEEDHLNSLDDINNAIKDGDYLNIQINNTEHHIGLQQSLAQKSKRIGDLQNENSNVEIMDECFL